MSGPHPSAHSSDQAQACVCLSIVHLFVDLVTIFKRSAHLYFLFFFNDTATTEIYTLSLHDALPISALEASSTGGAGRAGGSAAMSGGQAGGEPPTRAWIPCFLIRYHRLCSASPSRA